MSHERQVSRLVVGADYSSVSGQLTFGFIADVSLDIADSVIHHESKGLRLRISIIERMN